MTARPADPRQFAKFGNVGIEDCGAAGRQDRVEEMRLGGEIGGLVGVIVEMVAPENGKCRGAHFDAVEARLVEPVR